MHYAYVVKTLTKGKDDNFQVLVVYILRFLPHMAASQTALILKWAWHMSIDCTH